MIHTDDRRPGIAQPVCEVCHRRGFAAPLTRRYDDVALAGLGSGWSRVRLDAGTVYLCPGCRRRSTDERADAVEVRGPIVQRVAEEVGAGLAALGRELAAGLMPHVGEVAAEEAGRA